MSSEKEVIKIAQNWETKVPQRVQKRVVGDGHSGFPHLLLPDGQTETGRQRQGKEE